MLKAERRTLNAKVESTACLCIKRLAFYFCSMVISLSRVPQYQKRKESLMRVVSAGVPGKEITILNNVESTASSTTRGFNLLYIFSAVALYFVVCSTYLYIFEGPVTTGVVAVGGVAWAALPGTAAVSDTITLSFLITFSNAFLGSLIFCRYCDVRPCEVSSSLL